MPLHAIGGNAVMAWVEQVDVGLIDHTWPARYPQELAERLQHLIDIPDG